MRITFHYYRPFATFPRSIPTINLNRWSVPSTQYPSIRIHCSWDRVFTRQLGNFAVKLCNFKTQTIIISWKSVKPENQNSDLWNFLHWAHQFLLCKSFKKLWEFIKSLQAIFIYVDFTRLSFKNFTGCKLCRTYYLKTVLESWIPGQKLSSLFFRILACMVNLSC